MTGYFGWNLGQDDNLNPRDGEFLRQAIADAIYAAIEHTHSSGGGDISVDWADILNKPATFPPSTHDHEITIDWGELANIPDSFPPTSHASVHHAGGLDAIAPADIGAEEAGTAADAIASHKAESPAHDWGAIGGKPAAFPPENHTHAFSEASVITISNNSIIAIEGLTIGMLLIYARHVLYSTFNCILAYRVDFDWNFLKIITSTDPKIKVSQVSPTGPPGQNGDLTFFPNNDGMIYIQNRTGRTLSLGYYVVNK